MAHQYFKKVVLGCFILLYLFSCNNDDNTVLPNPNQVAGLNTGTLTQWTDLILELERYCEGMRPNASARAFAYINLAAYETTVAGMPNYDSNIGKYESLTIDFKQFPSNIDYDLALNSCLSKVTSHFLFSIPSRLKPKIEALENELLLNSKSNKVLIEASRTWGDYVANQVIAFSQTDMEAENQILSPQPLSYEPPVGAGFWTYSANEERALFPYWHKVRTFIIDVNEVSSVAPLTYSTNPESDYYKEMIEVQESNNAAKTTDTQALWIAEFWSDDVENLMFSPPARQISIANQLIIQEKLNLEEALVLNLKLGFSLNDAAVATWKHKYDYMVIRPNVFIKEYIDNDFETNLYRLVFWPNPSFPAYPSGHSSFASAAAGIFIDTFGNNTKFTDRSHEGRTEFQGQPRTYLTIEDMAKENAYSRIPLGVHMRMDCAEGLRLGYEIADAVNKKTN